MVRLCVLKICYAKARILLIFLRQDLSTHFFKLSPANVRSCKFRDRTSGSRGRLRSRSRCPTVFLVCCSLRRGMATSCRRRGRDATPAAGSGVPDADTECSSGRPVDPLAPDIRTDDCRVPAERFRATRLAPVSRRSPWTHLHAVRGLRQLRCPGVAVAHRIRYC